MLSREVMWELLAKIVPLVFVAASLVAISSGKADRLLALIPLSLAFGGFNVYAIGTIWFPVKVVTSFSLLYCLFRTEWTHQLVRRNFGIWWILVLAVGGATLMGWLVAAPLAEIDKGGLRGTALRPLVQAFSYVSYLSLIPLTLMGLRNKKEIAGFFNAYAIAGTVAVIGAGAQLLCFAVGIEFMPILRMHGEHNETAGFSSGGATVFRLYSFCGEPKALAAFLLPLAIASAVRLAVGSREVSKVWWASLSLVLAFLIVTVLTFSSAVLIALAAVLVIGFPLIAPKVKSFGSLISVGILAAISIPVVTSLVVSSEDFSVVDLLLDRTVDRIDETYEERPEALAMNYLFEERVDLLPFGVGLGMYNFHLPGLYWGRGLQPINSGWVTFLMDFGLLGTLFWGGIFGMLLWRAIASVRVYPLRIQIWILPAIGGLLAALMMHAGWNVTAMIVLWGGVLLATAKGPEKKRTRPRKGRSRDPERPRKKGSRNQRSQKR